MIRKTRVRPPDDHGFNSCHNFQKVRLVDSSTNLLILVKMFVKLINRFLTNATLLIQNYNSLLQSNYYSQPTSKSNWKIADAYISRLKKLEAFCLKIIFIKVLTNMKRIQLVVRAIWNTCIMFSILIVGFKTKILIIITSETFIYFV